MQRPFSSMWPAMNFNIDCAAEGNSHSLRILPLLVAIREWSRAKEDAFSQVDVVLTILQAVQAFSDTELASNETTKLFTAAALKERLTEIDKELAEQFSKSLHEVSSDLNASMNLFDDLSNLFKLADDDVDSISVLDVDCNNSVIGLLVRQCLLAYKTLTFTQLMRYHNRLQQFLSNKDEQQHQDTLTKKVEFPQTSLDDPLLKRQDFTSALRGLKLWASGSGSGPSNHGNGGNVKRPSSLSNQEIGFEALHLAELHGRFGHKEEAMFALQEAIRLAQQHNNALLLEYALAWLHKLQHSSDEDTLAILNKFVSNAKELNLATFGGWGRLQQAKTHISLAREPKCVLETILSSDVDFNPVYEEKMESKKKAVLRCSSLAMQTATWEHYGQRLIALHYAQLLCHMTSCDPFPKSLEEKEAFTLSLRLFCQHFADIGEYEKAEKLLTSAVETFRDTSVPFKILCQCLSELRFDRSIQTNDIAAAKRHHNDITTYDQYSAMYRSAVLAKAEGSTVDSVQQVQHLLQQLKMKMSIAEQHVRLQAKCLLLLAELYASQGLPSHALPHVTECLSLSHKHHLSTLQPNLSLAQLQLQLGSPKDAMKLVKESLLHCQTNGSVVDRGRAYFLATQALLLDKKTSFGNLSKEDVLSVLPLLTQSVNDFKRVSSNDLLKHALILQAHLYNFAGYTPERDKVSTLLI